MKKISFGKLSNGQEAWLYTITCGGLTARVTDYGAALVELWVPDQNGVAADVVLGYADVRGYEEDTVFLGAIVGRNANRIQGSCVTLGGVSYAMTANEGANNLHSGPNFYSKRFWQVAEHTDSTIRLTLSSPHGDQGFPGNAAIEVTYALKPGGLHITYDATCDRDTVFNLTNHSYFNLAGHDHPELAMEQELILPARVYTVADAESIPTGELRDVAGTPMDFRSGKPIGRDIAEDYDALQLQGGYDHNFEVYTDPCAILTDPASGRSMAVSTDCPGVQFYAGNFLTGPQGKNGVIYGKRSGICLETQYYPDAVHHPDWAQPITRAGETYHSQTRYLFK